MDTKKSTASVAIEASPKPAPTKAMGGGGASAPLELVRVALVSGVGGPMVVTKKDGQRLEQSGRWKIVGPAELPVLGTHGRPGAPAAEELPLLSPEPDTQTGASSGGANSLTTPESVPAETQAEWAKFGEDHED